MMLIVFGGLPGTGKTTLSRALAARRGAFYLRIDTIEQQLRHSGTLAGAVGPAGYMVGYGLAAENLRHGLSVVADCVNPIAITRDAWQRVAGDAGAAIAEIELVCSDRDEHRRRVDSRVVNVAGLVPPSRAEIMAHDYEPWHRSRLLVDNAGQTVNETLDAIEALLQAATPAAPDRAATS